MNIVTRKWVAVATLVLAMLAAFEAAKMIRLNLLFTQAQTEIGFWGRAAYHPDEQTQLYVQRTLQTLLQANPDHPDYLTLHAHQLSWLSYWNLDDEESGRFSQAALVAQNSALISRPAHRHSRAKMIEYKARIERTEN